MGGSIAANLARDGFDVVVSDRSSDREQRVVTAGARRGSIDEIADCDVVVLVLPGPTQVLELTVGDGGLISRMRPGSYLINMSTVAPSTFIPICEDAAVHDVHVVDAPLTGAADGARDATLTIMVGAEPRDLEAVRPVLEAVSERVVLLGPVGAGTAAKLLTNMLWFIHVVAISDAMALGVKAGINPDDLARLIPNTAGASWVANHDLPNIVADNDDDSFTLALCVKDLNLIHQFADELGMSVALAELARDRFQAAHKQFGDLAGELSVARLSEQQAGVSIRRPSDANPPTSTLKEV
jgi:3-hydroxyisobutyrate dehydrogenase-like beta-hydroxyacid dehydrogenase